MRGGGIDIMSAKKTWAPPGWPWELELLALVFVIAALAIPAYISYTDTNTTETEVMSLVARAEMAQKQEMASLAEQRSVFWAVGIIGLYLTHLIVASTSISMISTPFSHIFAPLAFSMIAYFRLLTFRGVGISSNIVSGSPTQIAFWALGVIVITLLVARLRMARHMLRFRHIEWEFETPALFDQTFWTRLLFTIHPLIYPPHVYKVCSEGILVEGWLYVLPIPFQSVISFEDVRRATFVSAGRYFATSTRNLVRLQLTESNVPFFLSPTDRIGFMRHCNQNLHRGVVSLVRDTIAED